MSIHSGSPPRSQYSYYSPGKDRNIQQANKLHYKLESQKGSSTLNLADSFIGDEGCGMIYDFLRDNIQVTNVELRGNNIGADGIKILS